MDISTAKVYIRFKKKYGIDIVPPEDIIDFLIATVDEMNEQIKKAIPLMRKYINNKHAERYENRARRWIKEARV